MPGHPKGSPLNRRTTVNKRTGLGAKLHDSRLKAKMTQEEVGALLEVSASVVKFMEIGKRQIKRSELDKIAQLFDWDEMPAPVVPPRKEAPVAVTHGLRGALLTLKDPIPLTKKEAAGIDSVISGEDDEFSLRRLRKSAQYVVDNLQKLVEQYESTLREMHRLEQRMTGGLTVEQVETLRDKARRWDDLQAIMERKARV